MPYLGEQQSFGPETKADPSKSGEPNRMGAALGSAINTVLGLASGAAMGAFLLTYGATEGVATVLASLF